MKLETMETKPVPPATSISKIFALFQHYFPERHEVYFNCPKSGDLCLFLGGKKKKILMKSNLEFECGVLCDVLNLLSNN